MNTSRLPSFLLSLCLHLALLLLVVFWPAPAPPPYEPHAGALVSGLVTIGKEGKSTPNAKSEVPQASKGRSEQPSEQQKQGAPVEKPAEAAPPDPPKPVETPPPPPEKPKEAPKPEPEATPIPKEPEKTPEKKPEPKPEPKKEEKKPEEKKPEPRKDEKKPEPKKPEPKKDDLKSALADMQKDVGSPTGKQRGRTSGPGSGQDLSSALADLGKQVGGSGNDAQGRGPGGSGGDGYGRLGAYQDSVISRVRPNWSFVERADRKNYVAVVNILIDADGTIKGARIVTSSGNSYFDGTVMQAIAATERLEAPPSPDMMNINISFTPQALARH